MDDGQFTVYVVQTNQNLMREAFDNRNRDAAVAVSFYESQQIVPKNLQRSNRGNTVTRNTALLQATAAKCKGHLRDLLPAIIINHFVEGVSRTYLKDHAHMFAVRSHMRERVMKLNTAFFVSWITTSNLIQKLDLINSSFHIVCRAFLYLGSIKKIC